MVDNNVPLAVHLELLVSLGYLPNTQGYSGLVSEQCTVGLEARIKWLNYFTSKVVFTDVEVAGKMPATEF